MGIFEDLVARVNSLEAESHAQHSNIESILNTLVAIGEDVRSLEDRIKKLETVPVPAPDPIPDPTPDPTPDPVPDPQPQPTGLRMGVNLHGLATWSRELVFGNAMMHGSEWRLCKATSPINPWSTAGSIPALDEKGNPTETLPRADGLTIRQDIFCDNGEKFPLGIYKLQFTGNGEILLQCGANAKRFTTPGEFVLTQTTKLGIQLVITKNDATNPIKNIKLISPTVNTVGLDSRFVNFMKPFKLVRVMDLMDTNNSPVTGNAVMEYATPHPQNGVPINDMLDMFVKLGVTPWICLPHLSTDSYNTALATAVKARNIPIVYVEYSNELWNGQFSQAQWVKSKAVNGGANFQDVINVMATESVNRFKIWESVFGTERSRLKFVCAGQNGNTGVASGLAKAMAALNFKFDVISSAPYWNVSSADKATTTSLDAVMTKTIEYLRTKNIPLMKNHVDMAKAYSTQFGKKVEFIAYECGQHLVPETGQAFTAAYYAAQTDPRMKQCYKEFIAAAKSQGVDGLCFFNSCQVDSQHGCWGLTQHSAQDPMTAIKYQAIVEG